MLSGMRAPVLLQARYTEHAEPVEVAPGHWMPSSAVAIFVFERFGVVEFRVEVDPDTSAVGIAGLCIETMPAELVDPVTGAVGTFDPGRRVIESRELAGLDLAGLLDRAVADLTTIETDDDGEPVWDGEGVSDERAGAMRRLGRVATLYRQHGGGVAAARAIGEELHMSESQAYRLIRQARDAGLIPPKEDQR